MSEAKNGSNGNGKATGKVPGREPLHPRAAEAAFYRR